MSPAIWKNYWAQFEGQFIENTFGLKRMLGMGGFGAVFEAEHVVEGRVLRRVAVKLIPAEPDSMQRQLDELTSATLFQHPYVLRSFHAGSAVVRGAKLLYLAMEIADESLQARLQRGTLSPAETAKMTSDVASALDYLHRQNLVHRDLKSANVLLVNGDWKLSDFGTVRRSVGAGTDHTMSVIGTAGYMPPESFDGTVSPAWDTWSLGVLILESLTGKRPFPETSEHELIGAIIQKAPLIPPGLPAPYGEIARHCLEKNYRERWNAHQVLNALAQASNSRIQELIAQALQHRLELRWSEALGLLREAEHLDPTQTQIRRLINETEKLQRDDELQRKLQTLRDRARQTAASGDLDRALDMWSEVLVLSPGDTAAETGVVEIREQKRILALKVEVKDALDKNDHERAARLIAELREFESQNAGPHGTMRDIKTESAPNAASNQPRFVSVWRKRQWVMPVTIASVCVLGVAGTAIFEHLSAQRSRDFARVPQTQTADQSTYVSRPEQSKEDVPAPKQHAAGPTQHGRTRAFTMRAPPRHDEKHAVDVLSAPPVLELPQRSGSTSPLWPTGPATTIQTSTIYKTGIYKVGDTGVSAPILVYKSEPEYPAKARQEKVQGTVVIWLVVSDLGYVRDAKVIRSLGFGCDEAALKAVRTWRFLPGTKDARPVSVQAIAEVNFRAL